MKILVGFEESQAVCKAFRERGHEAFSNDLKECSGGHPEWHLKMDIYDAINLKDWEIIIMHPTCTAMALSGNRTYAYGKPKHKERIEAVEWTIKLWQYVCSKCEKVAMENPMGAMNGDSRLPKPQIIQPYYFGDEAMKTTCLWLKNLPFLLHNASVNLFESSVTHVSSGGFKVHSSGKRMNNFHYKTSCLPQSKRAEVRSKTFPGIAAAMAEQWGKQIKTNEYESSKLNR